MRSRRDAEAEFGDCPAEFVWIFPLKLSRGQFTRLKHVMVIRASPALTLTTTD